MGTSGAYGGSGGAPWSKVRNEADGFVGNPGEGTGQSLIAQVLAAVAAEARPGEPAPPNVTTQQLLRRARGALGRSDGPGGGGGGGATSGSDSGGGRTRGRASLAAAGGAALAAGDALRRRDADTLAEYGLVLSDLEALDPYDQTEAIVNAIVPDDGSIEASEHRDAEVAALLIILEDGITEPEAAVRVLVTEYVWEVCMTEVGDKLDKGEPTPIDSPSQEEQLHQVIEAFAGSVEVPAVMTPGDWEAAIASVYDDVEGLL